MVRNVHLGISHSLEMVETVLEVADVAWNAMEVRHRHQHHQKHSDEPGNIYEKEEEEIAALRMENCRLRNILEENLKLLKPLAESPSLSEHCPSDLYARLAEAVDSSTFLTQLESLRQKSLKSPSSHFPFHKATDADLTSVETIVDVGLKEPSLWVWVTHEKDSVEELSGIDSESYVIVNEEIVVDGVANFIAICLLSHPNAKSLTPEELHKTVVKAVGGMSKVESMFKIWHAGKIIFALSTWGFTLAGLYRHRAIVKLAAKGIATTGNVIMKAL